jgi:hypothetical protein
MSAEVLKSTIVPLYVAEGECKFYRTLIVSALNRLVLIEQGNFTGTSPETEFMNSYDKLIILYRKEGNTVYLDLAKLFRKAAHKIYSIMLKKKMIPINRKFLNLV